MRTDTLDTAVTPWRVVQLLLDLTLVWVVVFAVSAVANRVAPNADVEFRDGSSALVPPTLEAGATAVWMVTPLVCLVVFVLVPIRFARTPAMALIGLRIVRPDGSAPSVRQHLIRALLLLVDVALGGLVGLVVMLCSRRRQRLGDHVAGTLVVAAPRGTVSGE